MIGEAPDFDGRAFEFIAGASQISIKLRLYGFPDKGSAVFGTEDEVDIVFDEGLGHVAVGDGRSRGDTPG